MVARKRSRSVVRELAALARSGEWESALEALLKVEGEERGAAGAAASALLAMAGRWGEFEAQVTPFLADPSVANAGNVFTELTRVARRAASELKDPSLITRLAAVVPERWHAMSKATLLKDFVPPSAQEGPEQRDLYERAVAEAGSMKRLKGKPDALARHCWYLAAAFKVPDEMLRRYDPEAAWVDYEVAEACARVVARRGKLDAAWKLLEPKLADWMPVDALQVFPVDVLADPWLAKVMTPRRCLAALRIARGAPQRPPG